MIISLTVFFCRVLANETVKYLSRFLKDLSDMSEPLRRLTHKDVPREWSQE